MDRDFCGQDWLQSMDDQGIGYVLRIRKNTIVDDRLAHEYKRKPEDKLSVWEQALYFGGNIEKEKRI